MNTRTLVTEYMNLIDIVCNPITLWLFIASDIPTIVLPNVLFAFCFSRSESQVKLETFIGRSPKILFWIIVNLAAFTINNQRQPKAIQEDKLNKPWRPIAAGRVSLANADKLGMFSIVTAAYSGFFTGGGTSESLLLAIFGYLYNDIGLGNQHWVWRNVLNASGFVCFASGTLSVTLQSPVLGILHPYLIVLAAVVVTTIHIQDIHDQPGDKLAGRNTFPIVFGDELCRQTIALAVILWSCGILFGIGSYTYIQWFMFCLGLTISLRTLNCRSADSDKLTFKLYNAWIIGIYSLPLSL